MICWLLKTLFSGAAQDEPSQKPAQEKSAQVQAKAQPQAEQTEAIGSYALIVNTVFPIGGGKFGYNGIAQRVPSEEDLPSILTQDALYYTFYDETGQATPKRYIACPFSLDPETGDVFVGISTKKHGPIPVKLQPGEKIIDRKGDELFCMPEAKTERKAPFPNPHA